MAKKRSVAKAKGMACPTGKGTWCGVVVLLVGLALLLRDLGKWDPWGIQPWTFVFLLLGICALCKNKCK